jgi:hypothetical protein
MVAYACDSNYAKGQGKEDDRGEIRKTGKKVEHSA